MFLLRNAQAVEVDKGGTINDDDRPLTGKGEHKLKKIGKGIKKLGLGFDAIVSSPALRTAQTAEILAEIFDLSPHIHLSENLSAKGNPVLLIREITKNYSTANNILLVGHEGSLSKLISVLLVGDESVDLVFKKGGLCKLTAEHLKYGKCATLCWFITPAQLKSF